MIIPQYRAIDKGENGIRLLSLKASALLALVGEKFPNGEEA